MDDGRNSWNTIPGVLVAHEKEGDLSDQCIADFQGWHLSWPNNSIRQAAR
jgi:hypothetical protein